MFVTKLQWAQRLHVILALEQTRLVTSQLGHTAGSEGGLGRLGAQLRGQRRGATKTVEDKLIFYDVMWKRSSINPNVSPFVCLSSPELNYKSGLSNKNHTDGHYIMLLAEQLTRTFMVLVFICPFRKLCIVTWRDTGGCPGRPAEAGCTWQYWSSQGWQGRRWPPGCPGLCSPGRCQGGGPRPRQLDLLSGCQAAGTWGWPEQGQPGPCSAERWPLRIMIGGKD